MNDSLLRNRSFDQIAIGESASITHGMGAPDIALFAAVPGDLNPSHLAPVPATAGGPVVAHGMWAQALVSAVIGTELPGPGTVLPARELRFAGPIAAGDRITATVTEQAKHAARRTLRLAAAALARLVAARSARLG
ncbi:MAG: hypothetical protein KGL43_22640, partial [Burkholderiales bacterium]|nr:hypothetical protein [Burkholderiales bacterium]